MILPYDRLRACYEVAAHAVVAVVDEVIGGTEARSYVHEAALPYGLGTGFDPDSTIAWDADICLACRTLLSAVGGWGGIQVEEVLFSTAPDHTGVRITFFLPHREPPEKA